MVGNRLAGTCVTHLVPVKFANYTGCILETMEQVPLGLCIPGRPRHSKDGIFVMANIWKNESVLLVSVTDCGIPKYGM